MILYQLAKRMEQREQLQQSIRLSAGNIESLLLQKEDVEEQLLAQANAWAENGQDEFVLPALLPQADELQPYDHTV